jgi:hypothetical protein
MAEEVFVHYSTATLLDCNTSQTEASGWNRPTIEGILVSRRVFAVGDGCVDH